MKLPFLLLLLSFCCNAQSEKEYHYLADDNDGNAISISVVEKTAHYQEFWIQHTVPSRPIKNIGLKELHSKSYVELLHIRMYCSLGTHDVLETVTLDDHKTTTGVNGAPLLQQQKIYPGSFMAIVLQHSCQ